MEEINNIKKTEFIKITKAIALLDAIISPDWEYRYYSFNSKWSDNEFMASMRDGQGSYWFALITDVGVAITGNAKDKINNAKLSEKIPQEFVKNFWNEPAFETKNSSFVGWKFDTEKDWQFHFATDDIKNINNILLILTGNQNAYKKYANTYFEKDIDIQIINSIYAGREIDDIIIKKINNELTIEKIMEDLEEIDYKKFG